MNLSRFIRELQKLENDGWGRAAIGVNKNTLNDGNGTFSICDIVKVEAELVGQVDGDGFAIYNKTGSERSRKTIILKGHWYDS